MEERRKFFVKTSLSLYQTALAIQAFESKFTKRPFYETTLLLGANQICAELCSMIQHTALTHCVELS